MKKLSIILISTLLSVACTHDEIDYSMPENAGADKIYAISENKTRTELGWENSLPVSKWSVGDEIALFDGTIDKLKYNYNGDSAATEGEFIANLHNPAKDGATLSKAYAYYPYSNVIGYSDDAFTAKLPSTQQFAMNDSYGKAANAMFASAEVGSDTFSFKNIVGYLKITLKGSDMVKSVSIQSFNDDDKLSGEFTLDPETMEMSMDESAVNYVTIDCGEGVQLTDEGVSFIFALPVTTMANGFIITAINNDGDIYTKSTKQSFEIERNVITPMTPVNTSFDGVSVASNELIYFATEDISSRINISYPGITTISHTYNPTTRMGRIIFSQELTEITETAFKDITQLTQVYLSSATNIINSSAFEGCTGLTKISIPSNSRPHIKSKAFYGCTSLTDISITHAGPHIYDQAFYGCTSLEEVTFVEPDIYADAFANCTNLKRITFTGKPFLLGRAFYNTHAMTVTLNALPYDGSTLLVDNVNKYQYWHAFGPKRGNLTFVLNGNGVTESKLISLMGWKEYFVQGSSAYNSNNSIKYTTSDYAEIIAYNSDFSQYDIANDNPSSNITARWYMPDPDGVLGTTGFIGCQNEINILKEGAFKGKNIRSIDLPDNLQSIEASAFEGCSDLTEITIPAAVWNIGSNAFKNCTALTTITFTNPTTTTYSWSSTIFSGCTSLTTIKVPRGYKSRYESILSGAINSNIQIVEM